MNKQPEITERTRRAFMDAFCLIYSQKPIEKISVQEVAKKAGYNRSTFYQYFFDLNDLLACVEKDLLEYIQSIRATERSDTDGFLRSLVEIYESRSIYVEALLGEYGRSSFLEQIKKSLPLDLTWTDQIKDKSLVPYLIEYRLSISFSLFNLWRRRGKDLPLANFLNLVNDLYQTGISSFSLPGE